MRNISAQRMLKHLLFHLTLVTLLLASLAPAQTQAGVVPALVNFSGSLSDVDGKAASGTVGVTFYLYKDQQGGSPLWLETQNVQPDKFGHYTVMLGATKSQGLPTDLFASGEARWLGVQAEGQAEQPRVMLLAVPYALKAGDAQTVGGLPPSAFVLAAPAATGGSSASGSSSSSPSSSNPGSKPPVGGTGTTGYLAGWVDNSGNLGNSILFQKGTGATAMIGLNLKSPLASLDVNGTELVRGLFESATTGVATASKGFNSNAVDLEASSFSSATNKAVMQHFEWQGEPTGNNTTLPGATLNLLFGTDTNKPAETGLKLSNKGLFTFASGQTFPGTGTITGINAGTDLTGGGTSGTVTLNLDTTQVPQLNAANTFTQTLLVNASNPLGAVLQATSPYQAITGTMTSNDFFTPAIFGNASAGGTGVTIGVEGSSSTTSGYGVFGSSDSSGTGVYGTSIGGVGVYGAATGGGLAGFFSGNVQLTGQITSYNGVPTTANGIPSIVFKVVSASDGNYLPLTDLYTPASDGIFRITGFQECTATSGGGTYFGMNFLWTLPTGGESSNSVNGNDCRSLSSSSGSFVAHVKGGVPIQYNYAGMNAPFQTTILIEQLW